MNSQILAQPLPSCSFFPIFQLADFPSEMPFQISPLEFGHEIDEEELASEFSSLIPDSHKNQERIEVGPQDFETCFSWFLS
jgi:hypothetical protein